MAVARTLGVSVGCGGGRGVHGVRVGRGRRVGGHGATLCATMNNHRIIVGAVLLDSTTWRVRAGMQGAEAAQGRACCRGPAAGRLSRRGCSPAR